MSLQKDIFADTVNVSKSVTANTVNAGTITADTITDASMNISSATNYTAYAYSTNLTVGAGTRPFAYYSDQVSTHIFHRTPGLTCTANGECWLDLTTFEGMPDVSSDFIEENVQIVGYSRLFDTTDSTEIILPVTYFVGLNLHPTFRTTWTGVSGHVYNLSVTIHYLKA